MSDIKNKGGKTLEDLKKEILKDDPNYIFPESEYIHQKEKPKDNVVNLKEPVVIPAKLRPHYLSDYLKIPIVKSINILTPVFPNQSINMIYAGAGVGKTTFALNLAYTIALGSNFAVYHCPLPRKVLYMDAEMQNEKLNEKINEAIKFYGTLDYSNNLSIINRELTFPEPFYKIDQEKYQKIILQLVREEKYDIIFFDNLATLTTIDLNSPTEWNIVENFFLTLKFMGVTVVFLHHSGKGDDYRGTTRIIDVLNTAINLQTVILEVPDEARKNIHRFNVSYKKTRDFGGLDAAPFEVQLENGVWSHKSSQDTKMDRAVECSLAGMKQFEIAREMGISQTTVNRLLKKAEMCGRLKNTR
jgi:KaiC/GvpD/RAD55 family RecA-like ATPase/DNA-binding CsgD family transcriptional regulator